MDENSEQISTTQELRQNNITNTAIRYLEFGIIAVLIIATAFLGYQNFSLTQEIKQINSQLPTSAEPLSSSTTNTFKEFDTNVEWRPYVSKYHGFTISFPSTWSIDIEDSSLLKVSKKLSSDSINTEFCNPQLDCYPTATIEITVANKPSNITSIYDFSLCSYLGECQAASKAEYFLEGTTHLRLEYLQTDSIYPNLTYAVQTNRFFKLKAFLPSVKNCTGNCPVYQDSEAVLHTAKEIKQIVASIE